MKNYVIGFLTCLLILVSVFAFYEPVQADVTPIEFPPNAIGYFKEPFDYSSYGATSVSTGMIIVGYQDGNQQYPILKEGVLITFSSLPTSNELEVLDLEMSNKGLTRESGTTIVAKTLVMDEAIEDLATTVNTQTSPAKNPIKNMLQYWKDNRK